MTGRFAEEQIRQLETCALGAVRTLLEALPRCSRYPCNKLATHICRGRQCCSDHGHKFPCEYPWAKAARDAEGLLWAVAKARREKVASPPDPPVRGDEGERDE